MYVRDGMTSRILTVGPEHTLREVAELMASRNVGSAVVLDPDGEGPGIITERDIIRSIAAGEHPDEEIVSDHLTSSARVATPDSSLETAAQIMVDGGFRHLVVLDGPGLAGMLSMRDIVRCWVEAGLVTPARS